MTVYIAVFPTISFKQLSNIIYFMPVQMLLNKRPNRHVLHTYFGKLEQHRNILRVARKYIDISLIYRREPRGILKYCSRLPNKRSYVKCTQ